MLQTGVFPTIGREQELWALPCLSCKGEPHTKCEECGGRGKRRWKTGRQTIAVQMRLWEWVKPRLPNYYEPFERLVEKGLIEKLTPQQAMAMTSDAAERTAAMNNIMCAEAQKILSTTLEGVIHNFMELLRENHPDIVLDLAGEILEDLGKQRLQQATDEYNKNHPDYPPITFAEATVLFKMSLEDFQKWEATRIRNTAEGEYPPAPKDEASAAA
jgi:hypothetical protein